VSARAAVRAYLERYSEELSGEVYPFLVFARATQCGTRLDSEPRGIDDPLRVLLDGSKPPELQALVRESDSGALAFDACVLIVEQLLGRGEPLPAPLSEFVLDVLRQTKRRPRRRGGSRYKLLARNFRIRMAVYIATTHGLQPTRNEETAADSQSGCDVVADCLTEFGIKLKPAAIAKIWENRPYD
jgi:hypothetical protein